MCAAGLWSTPRSKGFAKCDVEQYSFSRNEQWSGDVLSIYSFDEKSKTQGQC